MQFDWLTSNRPKIALINCYLSSDRFIAKLVFCDRFIFDQTATLTSNTGTQFTIIVPSEIKGLEKEYTGVHDGLFDFLLANI